MTNENQQPAGTPSGTTNDNEPNSPNLEDHIKSRSTWLRLFYMLVLGFLYGVSRLVIVSVVVIQFFTVLLTGEINGSLRALGHSLAIYSYQIVNFLTFNTERLPFPFGSRWPISLKDAED